MLRLISHLFKLNYETCKSCETLKQQLTLANEEKKQLTETLLGLIKPQTYEAVPIELQQTQPKLALWSKRRAVLEANDRARLDAQHKAARPDSANDLETKESIEALEREVNELEAQGRK